MKKKTTKRLVLGGGNHHLPPRHSYRGATFRAYTQRFPTDKSPDVLVSTPSIVAPGPRLARSLISSADRPGLEEVNS